MTTMGDQAKELSGPDLTQGVAADAVREGAVLLGHASGEAVLLTRVGGTCSAIGATCTHYSGPLAEGLVVDGTIRCPWHHACFDLRTGHVLRAPALNDLPRWNVEERGGRVTVGARVHPPAVPRGAASRTPGSVAVVGAGAAGQSVVETLRREGYSGPLTMFESVTSEPVDRPNLSKDYLAGNAQPDWIPLRGAEWYAEHDVEIVRANVRALDATEKRITTGDGRSREFAAIVLATGAEPIRLTLNGTGPRLFYLRTLADSEAIIATASTARRVVVLGASFIGLEVAASLRTRGLEVHVAAPESRPLERVLGAELGDFIRSLHEEKGVHFHLGRLAKSLDTGHVVLDDGSRIAADFIVAGVGVRPRTQLAESAGLRTDKGVVVNEYLETGAAGIYAVGDIARWPDPHTGSSIRVEHWVVAQRQGQTAARNILRAGERFEAVPFFWSAHYDVSINYVGHAETWDRTQLDGSPSQRNCTVRYFSGTKELAVATIFRDRESLEAEVRMERVAT
jgi:NADPH-dependent 2,4-dienoyl-CoA reductase/sulfur reductase-like enzyme/nitrite reductase/ring-hydroxylating ferredoxin subunit